MPLSRKPQNMKGEPDAWYYEKRGGIEVHVDVRDTFGMFEKHLQIKIPWKKLKATMRRYHVERLKVVKR